MEATPKGNGDMMERKRCCCNCGRCIRVKGDNGMVKYNQCELDEHYIGYIETFEGWCPRWKRDRKWDKENTNETN